MRSLIATGILMFSGIALADESAIASIRKEYQLIQQALPALKKEDIELEDYALEGADATAYRDKAGQIRLIRADLFHESGKQFMKFYYDKGVLIFALVVRHSYNQNTSITPEIAKKEGYDHAFDPKKTLITEDRYYFVNAKMIRWIGEDKKERKPGSEEFNDAEDGVMEISNDLLSKFKTNPSSSSNAPAPKRAAP